ncbi:hypothetical protein ABBQ32_012434 [Trebouxia sp. C0010 RCD-2024]
MALDYNSMLARLQAVTQVQPKRHSYPTKLATACHFTCRFKKLEVLLAAGAGANSLTAEVARYRMSGSSDFDKATSTEALRVLQCWQPCSPQSSLQATSKHTLLGFAQWAGLMSTKQQAER